jgi:hypothetical protein
VTDDQKWRSMLRDALVVLSFSPDELALLDRAGRDVK